MPVSTPSSINAVLSSDDEVIHLPKPGQTVGTDLRIQTIEFIITNKLTIKELKAVLKDYGQPISGNRASLIKRLRDFAADRDNWSILFQPKVKRKRGDFTGARASKHSAKRIAFQFGMQEHEIKYKSKRDAGRVQRSINESERHWNRTWATAVMQMQPPTSSKPDSAPTEMQLSVDAQVNISPLDNQGGSESAETSVNAEAASVRIRRLERQIASLKDYLVNHISRLEMSTIIHPAAVNVQHLPAGDVAPTALSASPLGNLAFQASETQSLQAGHAGGQELGCKNTITLCFDGQKITVDKSHVPDPPGVRFSEDLSSLFREWHKSKILQINGHGIAVKHWDQIYKSRVGIKGKAWSVIKSLWSNWKFIAEERDKYPSEAEFWNRFSNAEGNHLSYQQILQLLHKDRMSYDSRDAAAARIYFGGNLDRPDAQGAFRYVKSGVTRIAIKEAVIAKKWRRLLARDPEIARRWVEMQQGADI